MSATGEARGQHYVCVSFVGLPAGQPAALAEVVVGGT
jgi:hypothetical protein